MNSFLQSAVGSWKSTASNALTLVVLAGGYFTAIPSPTLQEHGVSQNTVFWITVVVGLAKLLVGAMTHDANPAVTSSVTVQSTSPIVVPPVTVEPPKETPKP